MLVLEAYRLAAVVAEIWPDRVEGPAIIAKHFGRVERIDLDFGRAILTICTEMVEGVEISGFTVPVADLVLDIFQGRGFAKIRDRKDRRKNGLEPDIIPFLRDQVHLEKTIIRFALDFDQVRNLGRC